MKGDRLLATALLAGTLLATRPADAQRLLAAVFLFEIDDVSQHGAMPGQASNDRVRLGRTR